MLGRLQALLDFANKPLNGYRTSLIDPPPGVSK